MDDYFLEGTTARTNAAEQDRHECCSNSISLQISAAGGWNCRILRYQPELN